MTSPPPFQANSSSESSTRFRSKPLAAFALLLLVPAPIIGVALAMFVESTRGTPVGMGVYAASKIWILILPIIWLFLIDQSKPSWSPARHGGLMTGAMLGVLIGIAIVVGYFVFGDLIDPQAIREAASRNGIGTPARYLLLVIPLAMINSLLEEYVWRWFVFRKCEVLVGSMAAVVLSALLFSAHHLLALRAQMGWPVALLGTLGVFVGGCAWSWCYQRYRSIWPGYVSHIIADIAVFAVGWLALFGDTSPIQ